MDELYEDCPCGITGLTYDGFKQISSNADVVRFRESAMVGEEPNMLAMLASDQCRNGITLHLPDGSVERIAGTVLSQAERAAEVVNRYNPKLVVEGTKSAVHRFPRMAVRESLMNAVAHRDYSIPGDIEVDIGDDSVRIVSPGTSISPGRRNPKLADLIDRHNYKGFVHSGNMAIRRSYARSGYDPEFSSSDGFFRVILPAVVVVRGHYGGKKERIVGYMREHGGVSADEIAAVIGYSTAYTRRVLDHMERDGIVARMSRGRMTRFYLCNRR